MLLLNIALLALSALPTSLARHHRSPSLTTASTFATQTSTTNATMPLTTMSGTVTASAPGGLAACPTVTVQVQKVDGICPLALCKPLTPIFPVTSTTTVSCACPAAMATSTTSVCDPYDACATTTSWVYRTTGAC